MPGFFDETIPGIGLSYLYNTTKNKINTLRDLTGFNDDNFYRNQADTRMAIKSLSGDRSPEVEDAKSRLADNYINLAAGIYGGPQAKGWESASGKFSGMFDTMPRFEISDNLAHIKDSFGKLRDVLHHPELFKNYPELENINVVPSKMKSYFKPGDLKSHPEIGLDRENRLSSILHEVQHYIQDKEGFSPGADARNLYERLPGESRFDAFKRSNQGYMKSAGEIEARDVEARRLLTPEQRRFTAPYSSSKIPLSEWLYTGD